MKCILLISFAALISFSGADPTDEKNQFQEECKEETGLDENKFKNIRKAGIMDESDRIQEEFAKCVALKLDLAEEDGSLKVDNIKKYLKKAGLNEDIINESIKKCQDVRKPGNNSGLMVRLNNCFAAYIPKYMLIVAE